MEKLSWPYIGLEFAAFVRGLKTWTVSAQDQAWFEEHHIPGTIAQKVTCKPENSGQEKSKRHVLWIPRILVQQVRYVTWVGGNCRALGCVLCIRAGVVKAIGFPASGQLGTTAFLCDQQCAVLNCNSTHKASQINKPKLSICVLSQASLMFLVTSFDHWKDLGRKSNNLKCFLKTLLFQKKCSTAV